MTPKNTKLELTWVGKENRPQLETRNLLHDPEHSYRAADRSSKDDFVYNNLLFRDYILAHKALEPEYPGKVEYIYIHQKETLGSASSLDAEDAHPHLKELPLSLNHGK